MDRIGRYRILGELGRGAMGVVYKAQDSKIGRIVAIKTIRLSDLTDSRERVRLRERLFREAQSAGMLSHPNIVTIYDVQEEGETAYVFMEFVDGPTLDTVIHTSTPTPDLVLSVLRQTAAALDYAHNKGIVHRDIKPANIMIGENGTAKITDFGVAKLTSQQMTQTGTMMGTPSYMSPEQIEGRQLDGRADQFSLAVIAYELVTGEKPFVADSLPPLLFRIVREEPDPPQRLNPTLGAMLSEAILKGLSKKSSERYASCLQFADAIIAAANATPGWQPMPHGSVESLPTVIGTTAGTASLPPMEAEERPQPQLVIPPLKSRAPRLDEPKPPKRRKRLSMLPFLVMMLAAFAVLGLFVAVSRGWVTDLASLGDLVTGKTRDVTGGQPVVPAPQPPPAPKPSPVGGSLQPSPSPSEPGQQTPAPAPADATPPGSTTPAPVDEKPVEETPVEKPAEKPVEKPVPRAARRSAPVVPEAASVDVRSSPAGARVTANDGGTCITPCSLDLNTGRQALRISLPGYRDEVRILEVPREQSVSVNLSKPSGSVFVRSSPAGAAIYVNGRQWAGRTPTTIQLPVGRYSLRLVLNGRSAEQWVEVKDGHILEVSTNW